MKIIAALLLALTVAGTSKATPVTWYLHDVGFRADPYSTPLVGWLTGSFTYDANVHALTDWDITLPVWDSYHGDTMTPQTSSAQTDGTQFDFDLIDYSMTTDSIVTSLGIERLLRIHLDSELTNSGSFVAISLYEPTVVFLYDIPSEEFVRSISLQLHSARIIGSGYVSTEGPTSAPEPTTMALVASSILLACARRRLRQQNLDMLGEATHLNDFLFGSERNNLRSIRPVLMDLQRGRCFYWKGAISTAVGHMDHFIAWARYPLDLGHNFVLADDRCNNKKRDRLPACEHLAAWTERNAKYGVQIADEMQRHGVVAELVASQRVAHWAYAQTAEANGLTWVRADEMVPLAAEWRSLLG